MTTHHALPPQNGTTSLALDPKTQELGQQWLAQMAVVNLDEVSPPPLTVAFREYVPKEEKGPDGQPVTRYAMEVRHARIETFIPHDLYLKTLSLQDTVVDLQKSGGSEAQIVERMLELVLEAWQLTEPDMTMPRLRKGLSFEQINGLFYRFFGVQTHQPTKNP